MQYAFGNTSRTDNFNSLQLIRVRRELQPHDIAILYVFGGFCLAILVNLISLSKAKVKLWNVYDKLEISTLDDRK